MIEAEKATYTVSADVRAAGGVTLGVLQVAQVPRRRTDPVAAAPCRARRQGRQVPRASDGVYGAPRILADLRDDGERVSRKTVAASLRRQGLAGICPRRFAPATTVVDLDAPVPKDLVRASVRHRGCSTGCGPRTSPICAPGEGWLYLCAVRDGCSRRVIGWAIDEHLHTDLVQAALSMAVAMRGELAEQVDPARRSRLSVHLGAARAVRPRAQPGPLSWPYRGVLGQRSAGIILGDTESRVLRPLPVAHQGRRQARRRRLDRTRLQPTQTPLSARYD